MWKYKVYLITWSHSTYWCLSLITRTWMKDNKFSNSSIKGQNNTFASGQITLHKSRLTRGWMLLTTFKHIRVLHNCVPRSLFISLRIRNTSTFSQLTTGIIIIMLNCSTVFVNRSSDHRHLCLVGTGHNLPLFV